MQVIRRLPTDAPLNISTGDIFFFLFQVCVCVRVCITCLEDSSVDTHLIIRLSSNYLSSIWRKKKQKITTQAPGQGMEGLFRFPGPDHIYGKAKMHENATNGIRRCREHVVRKH